MLSKRKIGIALLVLLIILFGYSGYRWYINNLNPVVGYQNGLPVYIGKIIQGNAVSRFCSDYPFLAFEGVNGKKYLLYSLSNDGKHGNFNDRTFIDKKVNVLVEKIERPSTLALSFTSMTEGIFYKSISLR